MGNQMCQSDQQTNQYDPQPTKQLQMIPIQPQYILNEQQIQEHIPTATYAKKATQRPNLFQVVEDARQRQLELRPFKEAQNVGVKLPVFYVFRYQAYYEGEWKQRYPHGRGKIYYKDGSYFQGEFYKGSIFGQDNLYIYPNGSYKRGIILNSNLQGKGIFVSQTGKLIYQGQWRKNKPYGKGKQIYPDGSCYEGMYVNGLKQDGNGIYRFSNGKVYEGSFKKGYMQGQGKLYMPNGNGQYIGQFSKNLIIGHGTMKTQTGIYQGTFEKGLMQGQGIFKWYDGKIYQGEFYKGKLHGNGQMRFPNGQIVTGWWHYGENLKMNQIRREG